MLDTSARLLRLLSLFQARRYWPGADLAERLEVTPRTLRRDVDRLRSLGYPVNSSSGTGGGYQLGAGATLPPLQLDDEEAVAVAVGLRTAASGTVTGIEEASLRALSKLEQILPAHLRPRVAALHAFIVPLVSSGPAVDASLLSAIAAGCRDCHRIHFSYRSRDSAASTRDVEPHRLVHTGHRWYLAAWDTGRNNWRTFRVDRIQLKKPHIGSRFTPRAPPDGDFATYMARSLTWAPYPMRARITFAAPAEAVAARIPPGAGIIEATGEKTCALTLGSGSGLASLDTMSVYLALIGFDFEVHEPPELIARVRELARLFGHAATNK